jgi:hypothetical protein
MNITHFEDIRERLGVTDTQIEMMIYSGGLIPPNQAHCWTTSQIEPYLQNWEDKIKRTKPKNNKNIVTGNCTFPRHQR